MDEGTVAKEVIESLRGYLQTNLAVDKDFIAKLNAFGRKLLVKDDANRFSALAGESNAQCLDQLLNHMSSFYLDKTLEDFCVFLEEYSEKGRPRLRPIAEKIRKEMKA